MSEKPPPDVAHIERVPPNAPPTTMFIAAISSSVCFTTTPYGSPCFAMKWRSEEAGVIGYAQYRPIPAASAPSPIASLPSTSMCRSGTGRRREVVREPAGVSLRVLVARTRDRDVLLGDLGWLVRELRLDRLLQRFERESHVAEDRSERRHVAHDLGPADVANDLR